jgi:hypothetical protein
MLFKRLEVGDVGTVETVLNSTHAVRTKRSSGALLLLT